MHFKSGLCLVLLLALANAARAAVIATGGSVSNIPGYRIHIFTNGDTFAVTSGGNVEVLVVAGGGGGGGSTAGGGGAGGYIYTNQYSVVGGSNYTVTVGAGGAGGSGTPAWSRGVNGANSVFGTLTAIGGGGGGCNQGTGNGLYSGADGGSGGGGTGSGSQAGGLGTIGQGKNGGTANAWPSGPIHAGGGGGGAGSDGTNGPTSGTVGASGGNGLSNSISGTLQWYAGGGGGGVYGAATASAGGSGIGGSGGGGSGSASPAATSGAANTGSGGGGQGGNDTGAAGSGGSGIVIVKYVLSLAAPGAPEINNANGATNVTLTSAWLNGTLITNGTSDAAVSVFWGNSDGGTNAENWAKTNSWAAPQLPGIFTTNVTDLASNTIYYYRFSGTNVGNVTWVDAPAVFMTSEVWVDKTSDAAEQGFTPGTFTVHRASSATNAAITVNFAVGGSAVAGVDYVNNLGGTVTFAAGASNATVVVPPLINNASNSDSTVTLTILPGAYVVGTSASATMTIANWALVRPATFYVNVSGGDNTRAIQLATSPSTSWKTITYALSQASSGDTISVAAGTYTTPTETFPLNMANGVTLQGAGWPTTIIDAVLKPSNVGGGNVIVCSSISTGKIDGFTIKGAGENDNVSGLRLSASSLVISNNRITGNLNWREGGAIWCNGGSPLIKNNLIAGNIGFNGGAIYITGSATPSIVNCSIIGNAARNVPYAGGIHVASGTPTIRDCIIWANGDDLYGVSSAMISYCDIEDGDFNGTNNNISADPLFVAGYLLSQTSAGQSANSPCLNAGSQTAAAAGLDSPSTRTDGVADNGQVDMGFHFPAGTTYGLCVYVAANGDNTRTLAQATNPATPWKTITYALRQAAITPPAFGWTINVASGVYDQATETFPLNLSDGIVLQGAGYNKTIIRSSTWNNTLNCTMSGIGVLDGFGIQGTVRGDNKTAIYCRGSFPQISNCMIVSNWCYQGYAGGIYCLQGACPVIRNNVIAYNSANRGSTAGSISGVNCTDGGTFPIFQNNTVAYNSNNDATVSPYGDGIAAQGSIANCIIWSNQSPQLYGGSAALISNCDISDGQFNTTNGCISADPLFGGVVTNNFRLNAGSPCIDKGTNQPWMVTGTDLDGNPRLSGASTASRFVDMGAYEYPYPARHGTAAFFR